MVGTVRVKEKWTRRGTRRGSALGFLSISLLCTAGANARTISFTDEFCVNDVGFFPSTTLTLSMFDPALGTLTKVTLSLVANSFGGSAVFDNEAMVETDVTLGIGVRVSAVGLAGIELLARPIQTSSAFGIAADNDGEPDFIGSDSFEVFGVGPPGSDSDMAMLTTGLGVYIGLGTFDVDVSGFVSTSLSTTAGGFGPILSVGGSTDGTVTVTYEFTIIPLPPAVWLGTLGFVAVIVMRRKIL